MTPAKDCHTGLPAYVVLRAGTTHAGVNYMYILPVRDYEFGYRVIGIATNYFQCGISPIFMYLSRVFTSFILQDKSRYGIFSAVISLLSALCILCIHE